MLSYLLTEIQIFKLQKCNHHAIYMTNRYFANIKGRTSVSIETNTTAASYVVIVIKDHCILSFLTHDHELNWKQTDELHTQTTIKDLCDCFSLNIKANQYLRCAVYLQAMTSNVV